MVGRSGKKSIGDVVETFILTIGGKVYTDSNIFTIVELNPIWETGFQTCNRLKGEALLRRFGS